MKTVITFGTFDLFHVGHLKILQRARALGDRLVVGVSTDALSLKKKGFLPIIPFEARVEIIRGLACADEAFPEESLEQKGQYIADHHADILVMGNDWVGKFDVFKSQCEVVYLPRTEGISSSMIKKNVADDALSRATLGKARRL